MDLLDAFMNLDPESDFEDENVLIAMPLFCNGKRYDTDAVLEHLRTFWKVKVTDDEGDEDVTLFEADGEQAGIAFMPSAIPQEELDDMAKSSILWRSAVDDLQGHDGHAIITVFNENSTTLEQFRLITKIAHSVFAASDAVGVYIPSQTLLLHRGMYLDYAESMREGKLPILLWVYFCPLSDENDGNSIFTFGMYSFGKHDMEIVDSRLSIDELFPMMTNIAAYAILNDVAFEPGEIINFQDDLQIPISLSEGVFIGDDTLKLEV